MDQTDRDLARKLYGVFEMLGDTDEFAESGTSRMLKSKDKDFFLSRAEDEFAEIAGVIDGSHVHSGNLEEDFVLESSQIFYWLALAAIVEGKNFEIFEKNFAPELGRLEKLHEEHKIPIRKIFEKDLEECRQKGYI